MKSATFIVPASLLFTCVLIGFSRGQAPATHPSSVTTEIVLEDPRGLGAKCYLDLDTGRTFTFGESTPEDFNASRKWTIDNGVDLMCETDAPAKGFAAFNLSFIDAKGAFDGMNDYAAATTQLKTAGDPKPFELISVGQSMPRTYLFRTRENGIAVLEVIEFTTQPSGIRLRVKSLPKPPTPELPVGRGAGRGRRGAPPLPRGTPPIRGPIPVQAAPRGGRGMAAPITPQAQQAALSGMAAEQQLWVQMYSQMIQQMTGTLGDSHPSVVAARARLATASKLVASSKPFTDPQLPLLLRRQDLERQVAVIEAEMEKQAQALSQMQGELRQVQAEIDKAQVTQPPATRPRSTPTDSLLIPTD